MTPARVVLLRHAHAATDGCCVGARVDPPLTAAGHAQARDARARLDAALGRSPGRVVSSPARRARETAAAWTGEPDIDPRLAERDWGAWEGRPWDELWAQAPHGVTEDMARYLAFTPPDAEPTAAVRARAVAAIRSVAARARACRAHVLVVTHAGPLRLAAGALCALDPTDAFGLPAPHAGGLVLIGTAHGWDARPLDELCASPGAQP